MKWLLRIFVALALLLAIIIAGAWLAFPWYAPALLERLVAEKGVTVELKRLQRPGLSSIGFGQLDATITAKPDSCTAVASTYNASILNGRLWWHRLAQSARPAYRIQLSADSVTVRQSPSGIRFSQAKPRLAARLDLSKSGGLLPAVLPDSVAVQLHNGTIAMGQLRLENISYPVLLTRSHGWVQQPARFSAASLLSGNAATPVKSIAATFGLQKSPERPCSLFFTDCELEFSGIRAATPELDFNLRNRRTAFELTVENVPLSELSGRSAQTAITGQLGGVIPVEYVDSTITISDGLITAAKGTEVVFKTDKTTVTFQAGPRAGAPALIRKLNATARLETEDGSLSAITLDSFTAQLLDGRASATPIRYDLKTGEASGTLTLGNVSLLDRLRLRGEFSGRAAGRISGTIPFRLTRDGVAITNAKLSAKGSSSVRQTVPLQPAGDDELFSKATSSQVEWSFANPAVTLNRKAAGKLTMNIALDSLKRKTGGGELLLTSPKGTLTMFAKPARPSLLSLSGFSAGLLGGTVSVDRMDYDLNTKHTETRVQLNGIPIQSLLDLQGASKLSATGTIQGSIPLKLENNLFSIPKGSMDAESSGTIVYSTTPEERNAAGAGMRMTYEALGNFLYSELLSTITMQPDGNSVITIQLKGRNPDFQENRPVNLNLTIEQNLLDLFRSLTLSSDIEQAISEKVLEQSGGKGEK